MASCHPGLCQSGRTSPPTGRLPSIPTTVSLEKTGRLKKLCSPNDPDIWYLLVCFPKNVFLSPLFYKIYPSYCVIYSQVVSAQTQVSLSGVLSLLRYFLASSMFLGKLFKLFGSQLPHLHSRHNIRTSLLVLCALNVLTFVTVVWHIVSTILNGKNDRTVT